MTFRHEFKHEISAADMLCLRSRLSCIMQADPHAKDGKYSIRSLYFDDLFDTALREKIDGVNKREKFRLRYYNGDTDLIFLEKKSKINGLCLKEQAQITAVDAKALLERDFEKIGTAENPLIKELIFKMQTSSLRAKTIVDYTREPYIFTAGNVRVTLDYNIRTGLMCTDFLNPESVSIPVRNSPIILEVKWDNYLPSVIRDAVQLKARHTSAFSKYAVCRSFD